MPRGSAQREGITVGATEQRVARFGELAREQLPRLFAIARRLVGDEAEDAVQDCLVKGFQRFHQLDDPAAAPAWLTRVLVNCCHDRGRHQARRPVEVELTEVEELSLYRKIAFEDPFPYSDSLHLDFLQGFGSDDVREVLLRLPDLYRTPLVLVYMFGFATKEAAAIVDVPLGTLLARLHRGRKLAPGGGQKIRMISTTMIAIATIAPALMYTTPVRRRSGRGSAGSLW